MSETTTAAETHLRTWTFSSSTEVGMTVEKMDKINARAIKRGLQGSYTYSISESTRVVTDEFTGISRTVVDYTMVVDGIAPKLAGWSFIATIEHDVEMGFTTRPIPGFEGLIDRATLVEGFCAHCATVRYRKSIYLLENTDGTRVQVGSSCIKDFLGHSFSPAYLPDVADLDEIEGGFSGGTWYDRFNVDETLALAIAATRQFGWVARSAFSGTPTASRVLDVFNPPRGTSKGAEEQRADAIALAASVTDADRAKVVVVKAWIAAQDGTSEYMLNLASAAAVTTIPSKSAGVLISGPAAYDKAMGQAVARESAKNSEFIGQAGDKIEATVEVKHIRYIESQYGTTTLYTFITPEGNSIKWFSTGNMTFEVGDKAVIKATVKKTEIFNEVKSTVVLRVKVVTWIHDMSAPTGTPIRTA